MAALSDEEAVNRERASAPSSLPPPLPKSPPMYPDLYGKRREVARLQMLDREILLLQEDLKFVEGLQPASACCKENKKDRKSCRPWKWICKLPCFKLQWLSFCHYSHSSQVPNCCRSRKPCNCTYRKCDDGCSCCFQKSSCSTTCCNFAWPTSSCIRSLCTDLSCHMPKCTPSLCCHHCKCINRCCNPCYSCCCL